MARVLGVDLGEVRIGLATSDPTGTLASPHSTLTRGRDRASDHRAIVALAREVEAERIVVGLPRSLSGADGPAARQVHTEVEALRIAAGPDLPVELHDERLTSVLATRRLAETGGRKRRDRKPRDRKRGAVDAAAAAIILQSWLDAAR
jgi:putative Holliday junction resolvase